MKPVWMRWPAVRRAVRLGDASGQRRLVYLLGGLSAISTTLLLINVGLIVNLLLERSGPGRPSVHRILDEFGQRSAWAPGWFADYEASLLLLLGLFLILGLIEAVLLLLYHRVGESTALGVMGGLHAAIFQQATRLAAAPPRTSPEADVPRLLTDDCEQLRSGLAGWWKAMPRAVVLLVLLLGVGLAVDFFLTLYALLLVVFAGWVYGLARAYLGRRGEDARVQAQRRLESVRDQLQTAETIAAWQTQPPDAAGFEQADERYRLQLRRAAYLEAALIPLLVLLASLCVALLTIVVGLSTNAGMTRVILLSLIYVRGYLPGRRLWTLGADPAIERAAAAILNYLDQPAAEVAAAGQLEPLREGLRLEQVSLPGTPHPLLQDASLNVPAGGHVALVSDDRQLLRGLTDLLRRACDPASGRILWDGVDLRQFTLASLRRQIALAPADGRLLSGTIADNIRCGRSGFSLEQVEQAAARSQALDEIQPLPHGLHTTVGPLGRAVGPYLAFRIGVARALLQEPALLIVEEPPEPPDEEMRRRLDQVLLTASRERTVIVLAARLSTLRSASRVYVFHEGRLRAEGDHVNLLKQDALYRHLNYLWFNPFAPV